jgi:mono/diheme cytochrome c family protein
MKAIVHVKLPNGDSFDTHLNGERIELGRSADCALSLGDDKSNIVSWKHLVIEEDNETNCIQLADLNSTNGTYLNDDRVTDRLEIKIGDKIRLGETGPVITILSLVSEKNMPPVEDPDTGDKMGRLFSFSALTLLISQYRSALFFLVAATVLIATAAYLGGMVLDLFNPSQPDPVANKSLELQVADIFKRSCYKCHGQAGTDKGGFSSILEPSEMLDNGFIDPSDVEGSLLISKIVDREMPPPGEEEQLSDAEIDLVKEWVANGAKDFNETQGSTFLSNEEIFKLIEKDLLASDIRQRQYLRYFTLTHLFNSGRSSDELGDHHKAVSKLVNSLSWKRNITKPVPIDVNRTILRIDLRDYEWTEQIWNRLTNANPYAVRYSTTSAGNCYNMTRSTVPFIRGDWFVFAASRPPLYHDILQLPDTDRVLEKLLKIDVNRNILEETVMRSGFVRSGVSQNNRLLERHDSQNGAYWKSYDFASNTGRQNLFEHPLGPVSSIKSVWSQRSFLHAGGEIIFSLPNGLQGYFLTDSKGNRIDKGPTSIVSDPQQLDKAVVNGISCMSCHYNGIKVKHDEIRAVVEKTPTAFPERSVILAIYPATSLMDSKMREDAARFKTAVGQTGSSINQNGEPIASIAKRFEKELTLVEASAEAGVKPVALKTAIEANSTLGRQIGVLLVRGGKIKRSVFVNSFADVIRAIGVGEPF